MRITSYVNEEKRTCVIVISDFAQDLNHDLRRIFKQSEDFIFLGCNSIIKTPIHIRGIAKCDPEDKFDAERGLAIAQERALKIYEATFNKELSKLQNRVMEGFESIRKKNVYNPSAHYPKLKER